MKRVLRIESGTRNRNLKSMGNIWNSHRKEENKESISNELKVTGGPVKAVLITIATTV